MTDVEWYELDLVKRDGYRMLRWERSVYAVLFTDGSTVCELDVDPFPSSSRGFLEIRFDGVWSYPAWPTFWGSLHQIARLVELAVYRARNSERIRT